MVSSKRDLSPLSSPQPLALRKTADPGLQAGFKDPPACYSVILGTHFQLCPWLFFLVKMKGVEAISSCLLIFTPLPKVISLKGSMRSLRSKCSVTYWALRNLQSQGQLYLSHFHAEVGPSFESQHRRHNEKSSPTSKSKVLLDLLLNSEMISFPHRDYLLPLPTVYLGSSGWEPD